MNGLRSAIGFLTILPIAPRCSAGDLAAARTWFPLVGLLLGAILAGADLMMNGPFPLLLASALLTAALALMTRALHLDGFMDTCDALLGGFERERRLEILRDPHVGAFAVVGVISLLLIKFTAIAALPQMNRTAMLMLFPCLSRWGMLLVMERFPYARSKGLGTMFLGAQGKWPLIGGLGIALSAAIVLAGIPGVVLFAMASFIAWAVGSWAARLLGGVTGDIYGAVNEVSEASVLILAVFLYAGISIPFLSPLWGLVE